MIDIDKVIDPALKIPNLALMKASAWHKHHGDTVGLVKNHASEEVSHLLEISDVKMAYISSIFSKNRGAAIAIHEALQAHDVQAFVGGTGVNVYSCLPDPRMENIKPDYDLYKSTYSQGYTTRGCARLCEFCVVPMKEGSIRIVQHPRNFHDDRFDSCMLMDNNLFSAPQTWQDEVFKWFEINNITMISPQGWDARLLNQHRCDLLNSVKHVQGGRLHFAWDNMGDEPKVVAAIDLMAKNGFNLRRNISFYVLCGYNTTFEEDTYRCNRLKELGVRAYAMRYRHTPELNALARWTARPELYWKFDFSDYTRCKTKWNRG